jgi:hypothetical protein
MKRRKGRREEGRCLTCNGIKVKITDFQIGGGRISAEFPVATKSSVKASSKTRSYVGDEVRVRRVVGKRPWLFEPVEQLPNTERVSWIS